ncbi:MAG TPA: ribonuclease III [Bryobacteraceae bacterium]|nr:ribonuclease III [Bryobacteraceae bacterium]
MQSDLDELERALGYSFTSRPLLARALTHSSSANELQPAEPPGLPADNERLEFLGDAILGFLVSESLFQRFSGYTEGQLSLLKNHLVSAAHLLAVAHRLELGRYLQLGRGEETAGGRNKQRLLVNAFEAVLAAVYLDGGIAAARDLLTRHAWPPDEELEEIAGSGPPHDFRAELERLSRDRKLPRPLYFLMGENGPGHARTFTVEVRVGKEYAVSAEGSSKKLASHNAARKVCELLRGMSSTS